jgi:hypothetical protein
MISLSKILSIAVIILAIAAVSVLGYTQFLAMKNSYNSKIQVSFVKSPVAYDYSCNTNDYQIYFMIDNTGSKNVADLSVSISNPLCVGGIPSLPQTLNASSMLSFYAQSSAENGTLTISGNNTFVEIKF